MIIAINLQKIIWYMPWILFLRRGNVRLLGFKPFYRPLFILLKKCKFRVWYKIYLNIYPEHVTSYSETECARNSIDIHRHRLVSLDLFGNMI